MPAASKTDKPIKIAFLVQLPEGVSPGQRFRCENWFPLLDAQKIGFDYFPFFDKDTYQILYQPGNGLRKIFGTLSGLWRRIWLLPALRKYDFVFIQREAAPIGPPVFEWVISKCLGRRIIFDFDDAIWIPQQSNPLVAAIKCYWKTKHIIRWAHRVAAGNTYLAAYARQFNINTVLLPTVVDTENQHNLEKIHRDKSLPVVGWTGSHSTLKYLEAVMPVLEKVYDKIPFQLLVIADCPPARNFPDMQFLPWKSSTEIEDLLRMDIGIMPLEADEWSEGKCGFKIIQYLALGIPAIATAVGVNKIIIRNGQNGFICHSEEDWINTLAHYLKAPDVRQASGKAGRQDIIKNYSIQSQSQNMLSLFIH